MSSHTSTPALLYFMGVTLEVGVLEERVWKTVSSNYTAPSGELLRLLIMRTTNNC